MGIGHTDIITKVCAELATGQLDAAKQIAKAEWPFEPVAKQSRKLSKSELVGLWVRDGFIDRYSGDRLIYPGALRLISVLLPNEFPYHKNWRTDRCHQVYWELYPTHDHIVPVSLGGAEDLSNIVTTSMLRNAAKANWTLDQLDWDIRSPGNMESWDGLIRWFVQEAESRQQSLDAYPVLMDWYKLARRVV